MSTSLSVIASASDCAGRGSKRLPQSDAPEPRRIVRMESAALPHGDGFDRRQGIATDIPLLPQPWFRPLARNALQAPAVCCHTMPALPAIPHSHQVSRRPGVSRFLKQARPDLFPGDDIGEDFAHVERCGNQAPPVAHPSGVPRPLPGFPKPCPGVLPSQQRRDSLFDFANRSLPKTLAPFPRSGKRPDPAVSFLCPSQLDAVRFRQLFQRF